MGRIRPLRAVAQAGAAASVALLAHTLINLPQISSPRPNKGRRITEPVSVLLPLRNEVHRMGPCVHSLLGQRGVDDLEIIILDDGSSDGTADEVRRMVADDPRVQLIVGDDSPLPDGWLGKTWACQRLGRQATGDVIVFIDADVTLDPYAVATSVGLLRDSGVQLISPYPRQIAETWLERLTQPMVTWSWMATLPMALSRTSSALWSAAIGQFLVIDGDAYRQSGGHEPVASFVVEDVEVLRNIKRHGYLGGPVNGGHLATCRMYESADEVIAGYEKSLWSVFGSNIKAIAMASAMVGIYTLPPLLAITTRDRTTRRLGLAGYAAGVLGRAAVARTTGERVWPDCWAMPASAAAFSALTIRSMLQHRRGRTEWKGRRVTPRG